MIKMHFNPWTMTSIFSRKKKFDFKYYYINWWEHCKLIWLFEKPLTAVILNFILKKKNIYIIRIIHGVVKVIQRTTGFQVVITYEEFCLTY